MINISKFLMLLALCNPIISENNEENNKENSKMIFCPEVNNVKHILYQRACQKLVALENNQLKWFLEQYGEDSEQYLEDSEQYLEAAEKHLEAANQKARDITPTPNDFYLKNDQIKQHGKAAKKHVETAKQYIEASRQKLGAIICIMKNYDNFMKYLKECNATEATISFFNIEKIDNYPHLWNIIQKHYANTEDETEDETIENDDNKNQ